MFQHHPAVLIHASCGSWYPLEVIASFSISSQSLHYRINIKQFPSETSVRITHFLNYHSLSSLNPTIQSHLYRGLFPSPDVTLAVPSSAHHANVDAIVQLHTPHVLLADQLSF